MEFFLLIKKLFFPEILVLLDQFVPLEWSEWERKWPGRHKWEDSPKALIVKLTKHCTERCFTGNFMTLNSLVEIYLSFLYLFCTPHCFKEKSFTEEKFFDNSILVTCSFCLTVVFHIETGHLFGRAKQVTDFYMKRSTGLKWVKLVKRVVYVEFVWSKQ